MNIQGCIPRFCKAHGSLLLTILGGIGLIATVAATAEVAPKAKEALIDATEEKANDIGKKAWLNGEGTPDECMLAAHEKTSLTVKEKIEVAGPLYLPVVLLSAGTLACMIGSHVLNVKKQASIIAAYALLQQQFSAYRGEIRQEYGEEADKIAYERSQEHVRKLVAENEQLKLATAPQLYTITTLPAVIFESNPSHMNAVFYSMLYNLLNSGGISLQELYEHIGIPKDMYNIKDASAYGWEAYENEITYCEPAIEFEVYDITRPDGTIVHVVNPSIQPYELGLDYGYGVSSVDNLYQGYDYERAISLAQASVDSDVICFDPPKLEIVHSF